MAQVNLEFRLGKLLLFLILLLLLIPLTFVLISERKFNETISLVNETNKQQIRSIEESEQRTNEFAQSLNEITNNYKDRNRVDAEMTRIRKSIDDNDKAQDEYLVFSEKMVTGVQSFLDFPYWLSPQKRVFINELNSLLAEEWQDIKKYRDEELETERVVTKIFVNWINDYALFSYASSLSDKELQDLDYMLKLLEPYKDYTNKSFTLEKEEFFKTRYPTSYSYLRNFTDYFANFYKSYLFLANGDIESANRVFRELEKQEDLLSEEALNDFLDEIAKLDKEQTREEITRSYKFIELIQEYEDKELYRGYIDSKKLLEGKSRNAAHLLTNAIALYSEDNDGRFPEADSSDQLYEELKKYLEGYKKELILEGINYFSDGESYYTLKYKDEGGEERERKYQVFN